MKIVIAGAGYAGLRVALDLAAARQQGRLGTAEVVLVDRNDYHQVVTWLHQVAAEAVEPARARIPLRELLPEGAIRFVQARVEGIEPAVQRLLTSAGAIDYDRLVVGLGADTLWPDIPGLREHAFPLRWWEEAVALHRHIEAQFRRAGAVQEPAVQTCLATIVVIGGGYTGTQLAGELAHWLPELADRYGLPLRAIQLTLVEAKERLMPGWERRAAERAATMLRRKGVTVRLGTALERVDAQSVTLAGEQSCAGTVVWAGGVRAPALLGAAGLPTGPGGRVRVNQFLQAEGYPAIFVAGDSALYLDGDEPLPGTAAHALRQGAYIAEVLVAEAQGLPFEPYAPTRLGMLVAVGGVDAVGDALGVPLTGLPAGLLKEGVERWYLTTIGAYPVRPQG